VILFDESIRGLIPGAPVEYRGVRIGEVTRTDIDYPDIVNLLDPGSKIPVMIEIEPARLGFEDDYGVLAPVEERIDALIADGLQAGLTTGNLLTGRKYVELRYHENPQGAPGSFAGYSVIPSFDSGVDQLLANASRTLDSINQLPLAEVAASAGTAFDQLTETLREFEQSAVDFDRIVADPATREMVANINTTLQGFQQLAQDYAEGSATNRELQRSLESLERSLIELEPVLRQLRRKPNSLVFGGGETDDPEPRGIEQ
jgi:paraquat-inducible protein B